MPSAHTFSNARAFGSRVYVPSSVCLRQTISGQYPVFPDQTDCAAVTKCMGPTGLFPAGSSGRVCVHKGLQVFDRHAKLPAELHGPQFLLMDPGPHRWFPHLQEFGNFMRCQKRFAQHFRLRCVVTVSTGGSSDIDHCQTLSTILIRSQMTSGRLTFQEKRPICRPIDGIQPG